MDAGCAKRYSDACVQTSPIASATHVYDGGTTKITPIHGCLKRVTYVDQSTSGTYPDDSGSRRVYPRTPVDRMKTKLSLKFRNQELSASPSISAEMQRRVVSLPERHGPEALSQKLTNSFIACSRNVSMPAAIQHFPQAELVYEGPPSMHLFPSVSYEEEYSHLQNYTQTSDLPHTPSLPSTPNSIEIIDGSFHFPDTFLRAQSHPMNTVKAVHKDWLTWTNSPPRPIPALHGPSSLPYARCPSGAEGTIIEEPSSVPGLIWGIKESTSNSNTEPVESKKFMVHCRASVIQDHPQTILQGTGVRDSPELNITPRVLEKSKGNHDRQSQAPCAERSSRPKGFPPEQQDLVVPRENIYSGPGMPISSPALEIPLHNSAPVSLNEQTIFNPRVSHSHHGQHVNVPLQQQGHQIPGSLLHAILHDRHICLDEPAPVSTSLPIQGISEKSKVSESIDKSISSFATNMQKQGTSVIHDGAHNFRRRNATPQNGLPTPPDSTSPLWSSGPSSSLKDDAIVPQRASHDCGSEVPTTHLYGLNLHVPAESLESLSEQLKRLVLLQQKMSHDTITSLVQDRDTTSHPFREQTAWTAATSPESFTMPIVVPRKPAMPISLHDLVVRHIREQSPDQAGSAAFPDVVSTSLTSDRVTEHHKTHSTPKDESRPVILPLDVGHDHRSGRGDILSGKRYPRSIPLTRLLERKLASVPEETSFASTSPVEAIPVPWPDLAPVSTAVRTVKKDYDFAELHSPLEETKVDETHCLQAEVSERSDERKVLEPAKQRKRRVNQKAQDNSNGGKTIPSKPNQRKRNMNDENVHVPNTPVSTLRKKPGAFNKSARGGSTPSRRGFGAQKPRRKD